MTICVPRKPFEIVWDWFLFILINSWVGLVGLMVYGIIFNNANALAVGMASFYLPLIFWVPWFKSINEEKHWIQWCKNKPDNTSQKESRT